MKKYTIIFKVEESGDSSYLKIPIVEEIEENEALGDKIGIYKEVGALEFDEYIDVDEEDVREFIKDFFKDYKAVLGFIRKITER